MIFDINTYRIMSPQQKAAYLQSVGEAGLNALPPQYQQEIMTDFPQAVPDAPAQSQDNGGVTGYLADRAKREALDYGVRKGKGYLTDQLGNGAAGAAGGNAAATGVATVDLGGGTSGVMLANGTVVPGVATDAATGGTVLADGSVSGGSAAAGAGVSTGAQILGGVGAAYGAYQLGKLATDEGAQYNNQAGTNALRGAGAGAALGGGIGTFFGPMGTLVGAGVGALGGALYGGTVAWTGSGKDGGQQIRDKWREQAIKTGLMDANYKGTLADGTVVDWNDINGDQGSGIKDMHFEDPIVGKAVAYGNAVATAMGATGKARDNIAGELAKGAIANANGDINVVKQNMLHFARGMGIEDAGALGNINQVADRELRSSSPKEQQMFSDIKAIGGDLWGSPQVTVDANGQPTASAPVRQSNGKYRLSPGVYSDRPPTTQPANEWKPLAPLSVGGNGMQLKPLATNDHNNIDVQGLVANPDSAVDYLKQVRDAGKMTKDEYNSSVYNLGVLNDKTQKR